MMWQYGAPMRFHWGPKRFWDIPVLTWIANKRSEQIWDWDAVEIHVGPKAKGV